MGCAGDGVAAVRAVLGEVFLRAAVRGEVGRVT